MKVHMVGIGGAGMSALARLYLALGHTVSGSDASDFPALRDLAALGATVHVGHDGAYVQGADLVVTTSAAPAQTPELVAARAQGIRLLKHAQALGELFNAQRGIAVAGTHGKTTTTAMIAFVLQRCGLAPKFQVGGELVDLGTSAGWGEGQWMVIEADEFDRRFLEYRPEIAVVTNVEPDHFEYFGSVAEMEGAFRDYLRECPPRGDRRRLRPGAPPGDPAGRGQRAAHRALRDPRRREPAWPRVGLVGQRRRPGAGGLALDGQPAGRPGRQGPAERSSCRGATTSSTPWPPWPSATWPASPWSGPPPPWGRSTAPGAASSWPGRRRACGSTRTTPTTPPRCASTWKRRASWCRREGACGASSSPTSTSARRGSSRSSGGLPGRRPGAADGRLLPPAGASRRGPTGARAELVAAMTAAGHPGARHVPDAAAARATLNAETRPGDVVVVMGAGPINALAYDLAGDLAARAPAPQARPT